MFFLLPEQVTLIPMCLMRYFYKYSHIDLIFLKAFDMARDPVVTLETLVSLGFQRVLTSGCDASALEGLPVIKRLIDQVCLTRVCVCVCMIVCLS